MSVSLAQIVVVIVQCCHDCHSLQLVVLAGGAHTGSVKASNAVVCVQSVVENERHIACLGSKVIPPDKTHSWAEPHTEDYPTVVPHTMQHVTLHTCHYVYITYLHRH